ncbi:MAG TPA: serine/threonine-protein kinase [Polyangiaceae bacterium]|nr:serine/threonine-protein kinase [Polyangiaceae bacterium]
MTIGIWLTFGVVATLWSNVPAWLIWLPIGVSVGTQCIPVIAAVVLPRATFQRLASAIVVVVAVIVGLVPVPMISGLGSAAYPMDRGQLVALFFVYLLGVHGFMNLRFVRACAASWLLVVAVLVGLLLAHAAAVSIGFASFGLFAAQALGMRMSYLDEKQRRRLFVQQRIIESQKETIAREHARSEAVLENELSYQVAQRSREIGAALARHETVGAASIVDMSAGARFDARYEIVRPLGEGGMGAVFEVKRVTDGQSLALKVVTGPVSRASSQRFAREAEIGARLRHPNLVQIVDVGIAAHGAPFLVMELIKGSSLEEQRDRFGDEKWARPILLQIARGLLALHAAKVVHRDLKPGNVLLSGDEPSLLARIADFGISRLSEVAIDGSAATAAKLTGTNAMLGTPFYMAPELAQGRAADAAADVFAFGIVAYEMLTGRGPFPMPPVILAMAGHELPPPAPIATEIVLHCIRPDPRTRPSATELVDAFTK